jgi:hypothetical protein
VVVQHGLEERRTPGNTLAVQPDKPYQGLSQFGTGALLLLLPLPLLVVCALHTSFSEHRRWKFQLGCVQADICMPSGRRSQRCRRPLVLQDMIQRPEMYRLLHCRVSVTL